VAGLLAALVAAVVGVMLSSSHGKTHEGVVASTRDGKIAIVLQVGVLPAPISGAPRGWVTLNDRAFGRSGYPIELALPSTWAATTQGGTHVIRDSRSRSEAVVYFANDRRRTPASYFTRALKFARNRYREIDRRAVVQSNFVRLPAGRSLRVTARLAEINGGQSYRLTIFDYFVLHGGVGYQISYEGKTPNDAANLPVFRQSAATIRFVPVRSSGG
jgi:hypothetical protein